MTCAHCSECDGTTEGSSWDGPLRYCTYCGHEFGGQDGGKPTIEDVAARAGVEPEEIISVIKSMAPFEGDSR